MNKEHRTRQVSLLCGIAVGVTLGGFAHASAPPFADDQVDGGRWRMTGGGYALIGSFVADAPATEPTPRESACYPDCDESGELDFFDFICFQNAFAAGDPYADCDENGSHDFFDFLCFQNAFAAGCP